MSTAEIDLGTTTVADQGAVDLEALIERIRRALAEKHQVMVRPNDSLLLFLTGSTLIYEEMLKRAAATHLEMMVDQEVDVEQRVDSLMAALKASLDEVAGRAEVALGEAGQSRVAEATERQEVILEGHISAVRALTFVNVVAVGVMLLGLGLMAFGVL